MFVFRFISPEIFPQKLFLKYAESSSERIQSFRPDGALDPFPVSQPGL